MPDYTNRIKKILSYIPKQKFNYYLIACSGGRDSLFLLLSLLKFVPKSKIIILHVNHGIRDIANQEESFIQKIAKKYDLKIEIKKAGNKILNQKGNLENNARKFRYQWFHDRVRKYKGLLCLGHNLNDQMETVLMKLYRGTGISGISGMPIFGKIFNTYIFRPLLTIDRENITRLLIADDLCWCEDRSNEEVKFFRNNIRKNILPKISSNAKKMICSIQKKSSLLFNLLIVVEPRYFCYGYEFKLEEISHLSSFDFRKLVESIYFKFGLNGTPNQMHMNRLKVFTFNKAKSIELNMGINVHKRNDLIYFERMEQDSGDLRFKDLDWSISVNEPYSLGENIRYETEFLWPKDSLGEISLVPLSKNVDEILHKKLLRKLKNKKVPFWRRRNMPVVIFNNVPIFVPYLGLLKKVNSNAKKYGGDLVIVKLSEI